MSHVLDTGNDSSGDPKGDVHFVTIVVLTNYHYFELYTTAQVHGRVGSVCSVRFRNRVSK